MISTTKFKHVAKRNIYLATPRKTTEQSCNAHIKQCPLIQFDNNITENELSQVIYEWRQPKKERAP